MSEAQMTPAADPNAPAVGRSFVERVIGVLRLDGAAYEEIASDPAAMGQAAAVVVAAAVGRALSAVGGPFSTQGVLFLVQVSAAWPVISLMVIVLGGWFGHPVAGSRAFRIGGFALAPVFMYVLLVVPVVAVQIGVAFLATTLLIATHVVGIRHALRVDTGRAGFIALVIAMILVFVSMTYAYLTM